MAKSTETTHWATDFDGDGAVFGAAIVSYEHSRQPILRLTFHTGNHVTTVELNPEDLGNFADMIAKTQAKAIGVAVVLGRAK
jgi:hypothetical protein